MSLWPLTNTNSTAFTMADLVRSIVEAQAIGVEIQSARDGMQREIEYLCCPQCLFRCRMEQSPMGDTIHVCHHLADRIREACIPEHELCRPPEMFGGLRIVIDVP